MKTRPGLFSPNLCPGFDTTDDDHTAVSLDSLAQRIARQQAELEDLRRQYEARQTQLADFKRRGGRGTVTS